MATSGAHRLAQALSRAQPSQVALLSEPCILVDSADRVVGSASKRDCHLAQAPPDQAPDQVTRPLLHRAFSLFLFDERRRLLLQRRAAAKLTFPGHWTNSVCSHPLATPAELVSDGALGVRRAAVRRTGLELGEALAGQLQLSELQLVTRVLYRAADGEDALWAEHELDYVLVGRWRDDGSLRPHPDEVADVALVAEHELAGFVAGCRTRGVPLTPWFTLICRHFLPRLWRHLDDLDGFGERDTIHDFRETG